MHPRSLGRALFTAAVATGVAFTAACGAGGESSNSQQAGGTKTFKIAVIDPMSGAYAGLGSAAVHGAELAATEVNDAGGLKSGPYAGSKIEIVGLDDQFATGPAAQAAQKVVDDPDIWAATGFIISDNAMAARPILERVGVPLLTTGASAAVITANNPKNIFITIPPNSAFAEGAAWAAKQRGATKAAVLQITGALGDSLSTLGAKKLEEIGVTVTSTQKIPLNTTDVRAQLVRARDTGADTLFAVAYNTEMIAIVNALASLDWHPIVADPNGLGYEATFMQAVGDKANGMVGSTQYDENSKNPANQKFIKTFQAKYGTEESLGTAIYSYQAAQMVIAGLEQGPKDRNDLGKILYKTSVPDAGVGDLKFDDQGNPVGRLMFEYLIDNSKATVKWIYDGKSLVDAS
jgi:branched-chain amino acid transport system substrate-binding protein